jgi:hypothetical protein
MISKLDYERLKRSFAFFVERYVPIELLSFEAHPVRVLEQMEKQRMGMARRGLLVAIADMLEGMRDFSQSQIHEADAELEKRDAYTLSFLRGRFTRHNR